MNKREIKAAHDAMAKVQLAIGASDASHRHKAEIAKALSEYCEHMSMFFQDQWMLLRRQSTQHSMEGSITSGTSDSST